MITSVEHDFCFIHIPKCGGTTIRKQLMDLDIYDNKFGPRADKLKEGEFWLGHLPLDVLASNFPDVYDTVSGLRKFVIVRDPLDRFLSAVSQRARRILDKTPETFTDTEMRGQLADAVEHLETCGRFPDLPYRHFVRQNDFTDADGARVVQNIYPIEALDQLVLRFGEITERSLSPNMKLNQSVALKVPALKRPVIAVKDGLKAVLPLKLYSRLKDVGLSMLATRGHDKRLSVFAEQDGVTRFIQTYYAEDYKLHTAALAEHPPKEI
ncbi:MAG: sulfotransferase family 2 domain-containing protein [Pseudomonadota bacterium]